MAESNHAETLFCDWLNREQRGEPVDLAAIAAANPDCAVELLRIHSEWIRMKRILKSHAGTDSSASLADRLRERFGPNVDPAVHLDDDVESQDAKTEKMRPTPDDDSRLYDELRARAPSSGRYRLEGEIAQGGMGVVMRVFDKDLRRNLAMKVMLEEKEGRLSRFLEEAQVTGQLDHPGIVPVHELGIDQRGKVFFTMKLVKGKNLAEVFDMTRTGQEGWNVPRALDVLKRVCEAMAFAHEKKVIHRDLKPANIMVGRHGEVYVMDWGLARVLEKKDLKDVRVRPASQSVVNTERRESAGETPDSPLLTMDGDAVGTPSYMPLEQAEGDLDSIGPRSDVYAVGAMLYHLLAGHAPFVEPGTSPSARVILDRVKRAPPDSIRTVAKNSPAELVAICEKAMGRTPSRRYSSMQALANDLRSFLEGRVVRAYESGAWPEAKKWVRRNRSLAASLAATILATIIGIVAFANEAARANRNATDAATNESTAKQRELEAIANEDRAQRESYVANILAAEGCLRDNEIAEAKRRLEACDPSLRDWEWSYLKFVSDTSLAVLRGHGADVTAVAWSPDGSLVASGSRNGVIGIWEATNGNLVRVLRGHESDVTSLAFDPIGSRIVSGSMDGTLRLWKPDTGEALRVIRCLDLFEARTFEYDAVRMISFDPSGKYVASALAGEGAAVWDAATGELQFRIDGVDVYSLAFSPDGLRLAGGGTDVFIWDARDGGEPLLIARAEDLGLTSLRFDSGTGSTGHIHQIASSVAFNPDGSRLASAWDDGTVRVIDSITGTSQSTLRAFAVPLTSITYSPDGFRIIAGSEDHTAHAWDTQTGATAFVLRGHDAAVTGVAYSPDGVRLVTSSNDGTLRIWNADGSDSRLEMRGHDNAVISIAFDREGTQLASGSWDGTVQRWNLFGGSAEGPLRTGRSGVNSVVFSPDGSSIAVGCMDYSVRIWSELGSAEPRLVLDTAHEYFDHTGDGIYKKEGVSAVAYSPDGASVYSGNANGNFQIWSSRDGHEGGPIIPIAGRSITAIACGAEDLVAIGFENGNIEFWDAATRKFRRAIFSSDTCISSLEFSPDGAFVAAAFEDGTVRISESIRATRLRSVEKRFLGTLKLDVPIAAVAFTNDGARIITGSKDRVVRVWDARSGDCLLRLRGARDAITAVAVSPDGLCIAAGSLDTSVYAWRTRHEAALDAGRMAAEATFRRIESIVAPLRTELLIAEDVALRVRRDTTLDSDSRRMAALAALLYGDDPGSWIDRSRKFIRSPTSGLHMTVEEVLALAKRLAEAACRLRPNDPGYATTLGRAQYCVGDFDNAIATLERSNRSKPGVPETLSFLARALHAAGNREGAKSVCKELRSLMSEEAVGHEWGVESKQLLADAEAELADAK